MLRTLNKYLLACSALGLALGFWNRNSLPGGVAFNEPLSHTPRQRPITEAPLQVSFAGVDYRVEPLFDYELYGLVVSYRQHDGRSLMHRRANDHLNVADVCVVWSDTAFSEYLNRLDFWNGIFTCNVQTSDSAAWSHFHMNQLANNHLITADNYLRDRIGEMRVGDQIRIRGQLARYGARDGPVRGTSTTRDDTGDGACETIFVKDFEIVQPGANPWRAAMYWSCLALLVGVAVHFTLPYRPYRDA